MFDEEEAAVTTSLVGHCNDSGNLIEHVVALPGEEREISLTLASGCGRRQIWEMPPI